MEQLPTQELHSREVEESHAGLSVTSKRARCEGSDDEQARQAKKVGAGEIPQSSKQGIRSLHCPFYKHDPLKYCENELYGKRYKICRGSFKNMHRLREHLTRNHRAPIQCPRCTEQFEAEEAMARHLCQVPVCLVRSVHGQRPEGITADHDRRIKASVGRLTSDEEKWKKTYEILFPGEGVPSPYFDLDTTQQDARVRQLQKREVEQFMGYQREHLPTLFLAETANMGLASSIIDELAPIADSVVAAAVSTTYTAWCKEYRSNGASQVSNRLLTSSSPILEPRSQTSLNVSTNANTHLRPDQPSPSSTVSDLPEISGSGSSHSPDMSTHSFSASNENSTRGLSSESSARGQIRRKALGRGQVHTNSMRTQSWTSPIIEQLCDLWIAQEQTLNDITILGDDDVNTIAQMARTEDTEYIRNYIINRIAHRSTNGTSPSRHAVSDETSNLMASDRYKIAQAYLKSCNNKSCHGNNSESAADKSETLGNHSGLSWNPERPLQCLRINDGVLCSRSFKTKDSWLKHLKITEPQRVNVCTVNGCNKPLSSHFYEHYRVHCNRGDIREDEIPNYNENDTVISNPPFKRRCRFCKRVFSDWNEYYSDICRHMLSQHLTGHEWHNVLDLSDEETDEENGNDVERQNESDQNGSDDF